MDEKFLLIIKEKLNLSTSSPVVIGFSGGVDSVCLASLFLNTSIAIIIAHFNHCLRETANRDEEFSREFAKKRNLPFYSEKGNVEQYAADHHLSIEEAARKMRYEFLFRIAEMNETKKIAVAHHADDQVETILMHLFRGSGMAGLIGMKSESFIPEFHETISVIRPLLTFWRSEIEIYCHDRGLDFVQDETNFSIAYERNHIRNKILPYLNSHYPGLSSRVLKLSAILEDEDEFIQQLMTKDWEEICLENHPDFIRLSREKFNSLKIAIQRRIIRKAVFSLKPMLRNLSFENVERLIQFSVSKRPGEIDIQGNIIAILTDQEIIFGGKSKDWLEFVYPQVDREIEIISLRDQILKISQHWQLEIKIMQSSSDLDIQTRNEFEIFLDLDQIGKENLLLRQKRDGDRFQPLGMTNGTIKMSDFFINEKLMKDARKKWPLLTNSAGEIIWIPGFRPGHNARVTTSSQNIVSFSITRINERNY